MTNDTTQFDWQDARDRYKQSTALPSSLLVPNLSAIRDKINNSNQSTNSPGPSLKEVIEKVSISSEVLGKEHSHILNGVEDATELVERIKRKEWSVEQVIESHLRMAAIAQQAVGCYSSIFFDKARARAKDLDRRLAVGEDCGRLCGVPISIKAHIAYEGTGSDRGFVFDVLDPSVVEKLLEDEERLGTHGISKSTMRLLKKQGNHLQSYDAVHVKALLNEGVVIIAKTVMPQSVMQLE
jgi:hypothetical protein